MGMHPDPLETSQGMQPDPLEASGHATRPPRGLRALWNFFLCKVYEPCVYVSEGASVFLVNCTADQLLCKHHNIRGFPTISVFRGMGWLGTHHCVSTERISSRCKIRQRHLSKGNNSNRLLSATVSLSDSETC